MILLFNKKEEVYFIKQSSGRESECFLMIPLHCAEVKKIYFFCTKKLLTGWFI